MLSIESFCFFVLFCFVLFFFLGGGGTESDYSLILYYKARSFYCYLLQLVPPASILMDLVDSFQLQIFQVTTLSTADVPGISQFPAGTSLNLSSYIFDWSQISTVPAIMVLLEPVLQSQMLLQMMGISLSCCAASLFLLQCTR